MSICFRRFLVLLTVAAFVSMARAQEPARAEVLKRIKAATAFVQVGEEGSGSAFCIHESGFFLTNEHVVRRANEVTLVLHAGLASQQVVTAKVVRVDHALDLALLHVEQRDLCVPLPLGSSDGLMEQMDLIVAGFPFGKELALDKGEYPSISINSGKISAIRLKGGVMERIQMDAAVNPGNSGGPVVDAKGNVVGVVVSTVRGAAVNFAIPVNHVHTFIGTPEIEVQISRVLYADRFKVATFEVKTLATLPAKEPYQVELILGRRDEDSRSVPMKFDRGVYRASAEPLRRPMGQPVLKATLTYPDGKVTGMVGDRSFNVNAAEVKLAAVRSIRFASESTVVLTNDKILKGAVAGLDMLTLHLGSDKLRVNPSKAVELAIAPREPDASVDYTVVVRGKGKEVARRHDTLVFRDAPTAGPAPTTIADPKKEPRNLEGFWVVESTESRGKLAWPQSPEEAIYIEGTKMLWVKKDGRLRPTDLEADIEFGGGKDSRQIMLSLRRGPAHGKKWQVIYKIEGNLLTIATNCDEERCPTLFTVRGVAGGAQFLRTYRRVME